MSSESHSLTHIVRSNESGLRLDALVCQILPTLQSRLHTALSLRIPSRNEISAAIRDKHILLNHVPAKPSVLVKSGDNVTLPFFPKQEVVLEPRPHIPITRIFENEYFLVIHKPAGILTHPTPSNDSDSVSHWIAYTYPQLINIGGDILRPGIVHRLDQDTSGLLLIAKTHESFEALKKLFRRRLIQKTYFALVSGHIEPKDGVIKNPIARSHDRTQQAIVTEKNKTRGTIRPAITHYSVLQSFENNTELVEIQPKTGRTHQIRVHLAGIGHPILGDHLYGTREHKKQAKKFPHHFLHAARLDFTLFGEKYSFESPLPQDFPLHNENIKK